jgi:N-acetylglucosaminyl-diphospho-decaprenol L-rhamnosyltransferase
VSVHIAFVTVNYNTPELIQKLDEFFSHLNVPFSFSFTVVDNGSCQHLEQLGRPHLHAPYIRLEKNIGYGPAINRGVAATDSKYICVMNSDITLNREALMALWDFLERRPDAGVCAPRLVYPDGREQGMIFHQSLFSFYANWFAKSQARLSKVKLARSKIPLKVAGVLGAFFVIRRSVIPTPSLFDEEFFFYYEDSALAHVLKDRGVEVFVVPSVTVTHVGAKSSSAACAPSYYVSRRLYLQKFYGQFHAKNIALLDRLRILRKLVFYSMTSLLWVSERLESKRMHYEAAWTSLRFQKEAMLGGGAKRDSSPTPADNVAARS